jgi:hypothetical protein
MQVALGAKRPARHKQARLPGDHRIGMDDAKIHSSHPARVQVVLVDGDGGGDREPKLATVGEQRDRSDLPSGVGKGTGQPYP